MLTPLRLLAGMLVVVGAAIFAINASDAPPALDRIPMEEVRLDRAELFGRDGSAGARLYAAGATFVFPGPDERAKALRGVLVPGDRLVIWSTPRFTGSRTVWQIRRDGAPLVAYDLTAGVKRESNRRIDLVARAMLVLGAAGTLGGWLAAFNAGPRPVKYRLERKDGVFRGVEYTVMLFDGETVSIEIDLGPTGPGRGLEVDARSGKPNVVLESPPEGEARDGRAAVENDERWKPVAALLELGANYVEVGCNATIVGARFPASGFPHEPVPSSGGKNIRRIRPDPTTVERIVACLMRLRDACA